MFLIVLAGVMVALFVAVWLWLNPGWIRGRLQAQEIAQFMGQIEKLPFPSDERTEVLKRLRAWLEQDNGKPFYMLNLMRYYSELRRFPGAPDFKGTPQESNSRYEAATASMLLNGLRPLSCVMIQATASCHHGSNAPAGAPKSRSRRRGS